MFWDFQEKYDSILCFMGWIPRSNHTSSPMTVPGFCRIDFTVYDELGGGYIGISLWAEYIR